MSKWIVAIVMVLAIGAWFAFSNFLLDQDSDAATPSMTGTSSRVCQPNPDPAVRPCGSNAYGTPAQMKARFKDGKYHNAKGISLPEGTYEAAKAYYRKHPKQLPASARTVARGTDGRIVARGIDWGFLDWTKKRLTTVRCVGYAWHPAGWFGCDDRPPWEEKAREVTMKCGGAAIILATTAGTTASVISGATGCGWGIFASHDGN